MKQIRLLLIPILMFSFIGINAQNIIHVDVNNTSPILKPDGTTWQRAFYNLQDAIDAAKAGDTIWMKKGIYLPSKYYGPVPQVVKAAREYAFILKDQVSIYGGFNGTETSLNQRVLGTADSSKTILDGNYYNSINNSTYVYHVVIGIAVTNATYNGLSIRNGNANGTGINTVLTSIPQSYGGGVFFLKTQDINWENIEFKNNYASQGGAGIYIEGAGDWSFMNTNFEKNIQNIGTIRSEEEGGGAMFITNTSFITIDSSTFKENECNGAQGGGAIRNVDVGNGKNAQLIISNSIFEDNSVDGDDGGGAIYNLNSQVLHTNLSFIGNSSKQAAAGVYNDGSDVTFTDVIFDSNTSGGDGGGALENDAGKATLTNVIFRNNSTGGEGGAMQNWKSNITMTDILFENNSADENGGAIINWNTCELFMNNTTFIGNKSGENGGAIFNGGGNCLVYSTNGLYYNNSAENGGAFYTETHSNGGSSIILTNTTITKNYADTSGGGVFDDGAGKSSIRNSIINGNTARINSDIDVSSSLIASISHSIADNQLYTSTIPIPLQDSIFSDSANNNFKLHSASPAIDAGDSTFFDANLTPDLFAITTDIRGSKRITGGNIDIGAYEMCENWDTSSVSLSVNINLANHEDTIVYTATATNGGNNPIYTWYKNDIIITGETGDEYSAVAGIDVVNYDKISVSVTTEEECTKDLQVQDSIIIMITGIQAMENNTVILSIYPNPSTGTFTLNHNSTRVVSYIIRDLTGREVYREENQSNKGNFGQEFNLDLNSGLYFFTLINEKGGQESVKFIIEK